MEQIRIDSMKDGDIVECWCKCGTKCDGTITTYSNGTRHAIGTCQQCGQRGGKQMRLTAKLEDIEHILMGLESKIKGMPTAEYDEAVCLIERFAKRMLREDNEPW